MLFAVGANPAPLKFLFVNYLSLNDEVKACLRRHPEMVVIAQTNHPNRTGELRALVHELWNDNIPAPVIFCLHYACTSDEKEDFQLRAAADMGGLLFDALTDGILLVNQAPPAKKVSATPRRTKQPSAFCRQPGHAPPKQNTSAVPDAAARSMTCKAP